MKRIISVLLVISCLCTSLLLSSCADSREKLYILSYGDYISPDVLADFRAAYPEYNVIYDDTAETPEAAYQKLTSGIPYDVVVCSDYIISKMIRENMLQKIDHSQLENYHYIDETLRSGAYDPTGEYTVPFMWGTLGIVYNTKLVSEPITSWSVLWDTKYAGSIQVLDSLRDSMAMALCRLGYSLNTTNSDEITAAMNALIEQKRTMNPVIGVDSIKQAAIDGEYALTVEYSGDALAMISENEDLAYVVPEEGSNVWMDTMILPTTGNNLTGAYKYIDFMCSTEAATGNVNYIMYSTPHTEAKKLADAELRANPAFVPSTEVIARCEYFADLGDATSLYNSAWESYRSAR